MLVHDADSFAWHVASLEENNRGTPSMHTLRLMVSIDIREASHNHCCKSGFGCTESATTDNVV